jgi:hypothetical protein
MCRTRRVAAVGLLGALCNTGCVRPGNPSPAASAPTDCRELLGRLCLPEPVRPASPKALAAADLCGTEVASRHAELLAAAERTDRSLETAVEALLPSLDACATEVLRAPELSAESAEGASARLRAREFVGTFVESEFPVLSLDASGFVVSDPLSAALAARALHAADASAARFWLAGRNLPNSASAVANACWLALPGAELPARMRDIDLRPQDRQALDEYAACRARLGVISPTDGRAPE